MFVKNFVITRENFGTDRHKRKITQYTAIDIKTLVIDNQVFVADSNGWFFVFDDLANKLGSSNWLTPFDLQKAIASDFAVNDTKMPSNDQPEPERIVIAEDLNAVLEDVKEEATENLKDEIPQEDIQDIKDEIPQEVVEDTKRRGRPKKDAE